MHLLDYLYTMQKEVMYKLRTRLLQERRMEDNRVPIDKYNYTE